MSQKDPSQVSIGIPIILILSSVLILTFTALAFIIIEPLKKDLKETQQSDYSLITRSLASLADVEFKGNEEIVKGLTRTAESMLAATARLEAEEKELSRALSFTDTVQTLKESHSSFLTSFILDERGTVLFSSSDSLVGKDLSQREYFRAIVTDGKSSYTTRKALTSASTGLKTIVHAAAVKENGRTRYVLGTSYNLATFAEQYFSTENSEKEGELFLFDSDGEFLISPDEEAGLTSASELSPRFEEIIQDERESWHGELTYGGTARRGNLFRIEGTGWYVGLTQENRVADRSVYHIRRIFIISIVVLTLLIISIVSLFIRFKLVHKVRSLENLISLASSGQLTERGHIRGRDEIASMTRHINGHLDSLSRFFISLTGNLGDLEDVGSDLAANMEETAASLIQIKTSVNNTLKNIEKQNADIDQGTTAVEEMVAQINSVNSSTGEAENLMASLTGISREGEEKLARVSELIDEIAVKSEELEGANALITGIAARTNLLAMNAAIEAAHAGVAGRGFAVVADEIRKLAEQSAGQSNQVRKTIGDINEQIIEAVNGSDESNRAFEEIKNRIMSMEQIIGEIRATMEEQTAGGTQVLDSFRELRDSGLEVRTGSTEMTEGNRLILNAVHDLTEICREVSLAMREIDGGMHEINKAADTISSLSLRNKKNIEDVRERASLYKVS